MKYLVTIGLTVLAFSAGSLATAAVGWKVFATATDKADYSTFASASASVQNPNSLGIRVKGNAGPYEVTWYAMCEGVATAKSGVVVPVGVGLAAKCTVTGSGTGKSGSLKVELLRR